MKDFIIKMSIQEMQETFGGEWIRKEENGKTVWDWIEYPPNNPVLT